MNLIPEAFTYCRRSRLLAGFEHVKSWLHLRRVNLSKSHETKLRKAEHRVANRLWELGALDLPELFQAL